MLDSLSERRWRPRWLHKPDVRGRWDRMLDHEWARPRWLVIPTLGWLRNSDRELPKHLLVPGIAVVGLLFGGGLYFGNALGSDPSAAGTGFITTVTLKGKVVTLKGKRVKVVVPPKTVTRHGKTVKVRGKTVDLTSTQTQTRTQQVPVPTTVTSTRTSTIFRTQTVVSTIVSTLTVTVPSS
ncbi:MAG TPA: hypothetical protein VJN72_06945 [Gaiellales bacterium]|nr:hypothetical protein [Gaiellales bacterium]